MPTTLISIIGSPGAGKSTLCAALARRFLAANLTVDHFAEEHILTRQAFAEVAAEFADGSGIVQPTTLISSTEHYLRGAEADGTRLLITDALVPYVPSLVAWGHDEETIVSFAQELERVIRPSEVIIVQVSVDPATTLSRAADREGAGWLDWYLGKLATAPGTSHVVDLDSAVEHLRRENELTRRVLRRTGWQVLEIDADGRNPDELAEEMITRLPDFSGPDAESGAP